MTFIEPGLYIHNGIAEGPLADAALSRAARAGSHDAEEVRLLV